MPTPRLRSKSPALAFLLLPLGVATLLRGAGTPTFVALAEGGQPERTPLVGRVEANRQDVPLSRTTALLDQKLRRLARTGLLRDFPDAFLLELKVDAAGTVRAVSFTPECGRGAALLEVQLLGWRLEPWPAAGDATLRVPVRMAR